MKHSSGKKIPGYLPKYPTGKKIIPGTASNLLNQADPETIKYSISHEFYVDSLCRVKTMDATPLRKVFENYKRVSLCSNPKDIRDTLTDVKEVRNQNHYSKYFNGLSRDIDKIFEFDASGYRGFFYLDLSRKVVNMIAIDIHPEDKKTKRSC